MTTKKSELNWPFVMIALILISHLGDKTHIAAFDLNLKKCRLHGDPIPASSELDPCNFFLC